MKDYPTIARLIVLSISVIAEETPDLLIHLPESEEPNQWAIIHRFGAPGKIKETILDLYPEEGVAKKAMGCWSSFCTLARKNMEDFAKEHGHSLNKAVAKGLYTDEVVLRQVQNWEETYTPGDAIEVQTLAQGLFLKPFALA